MNAKHTKGPWQLRKLRNRFGNHSAIVGGVPREYQAGTSQDQIALVLPVSEDNGGDEAWLANARLIASAPELLEALKRLVELADSNPFCTIGHAIEHAVPSARGAIAKAENLQKDLYVAGEDNKYTAIYTESRMTGSHRHTTVNMCRLERDKGESIMEMLEREEIADCTVFLFVGHPILDGEKDK